MKTWTLDNRPVVWTVNEIDRDTYDLYIHGVCVGERMPFEEFWNLYKLHKANM